MIRIYTNQKVFVGLESPNDIEQTLHHAIWVDLLDPTDEEIKQVEQSLKIQLPTKKEMYGLEISNRLYQEDKNLFLTTSLLVNSDGDKPEIQPVTFVIIGETLATIRYVDPHPFKEFVSRKERIISQQLDGKDILISLLENISERIADILEKHAHLIDDLSVKVFKPSKIKSKKKRQTNFEIVLRKTGFSGDVISKARESLASITRLTSYIKQTQQFKCDAEEIARLEIVELDVRSLSDHASFISNKVNFLLEATLGMISIQQNNIIKIFTVATMVFLPPTLIASIYGMNFEFMPELHWKYGYLFAISLMILSAFLPFRFFKKKGWL